MPSCVVLAHAVTALPACHCLPSPSLPGCAPADAPLRPPGCCNVCSNPCDENKKYVGSFDVTTKGDECPDTWVGTSEFKPEV